MADRSFGRAVVSSYIITAHPKRRLKQAKKSGIRIRKSGKVNKLLEHEIGRSLVIVDRQYRHSHNNETGNIPDEQATGDFIQQSRQENIEA